MLILFFIGFKVLDYEYGKVGHDMPFKGVGPLALAALSGMCNTHYMVSNCSFFSLSHLSITRFSRNQEKLLFFQNYYLVLHFFVCNLSLSKQMGWHLREKFGFVRLKPVECNTKKLFYYKIIINIYSNWQKSVLGDAAGPRLSWKKRSTYLKANLYSPKVCAINRGFLWTRGFFGLS